MQQKILSFKVDEQFIHAPHYRVVSDSRSYLVARFSFSECWQGLSKTAVFQGTDGKVYHMLLDGDSCAVPVEVIQPTRFFVSVFGGDRLTSDRAVVEVEASGYAAGDTPPTPTPDIYAQLVSTVETERQLAQAAAVTAAEKAEQCETAAVTASVAADDAQARVNEVVFYTQRCAQEAQGAVSAASSAQASASQAQTSASLAQTSASQAQSSASQASDCLSDAQQAARNADAHSDAAASAAAQAKSSASLAQTNANQASSYLSQTRQQATMASNLANQASNASSKALTYSKEASKSAEAAAASAQEAQAAVDSGMTKYVSKDFKQLFDTVTVTEEDIAAAGDEGITLLSVGDDAATLEAYSEILVSLYVPANTALNTIQGDLQCCFTPESTYMLDASTLLFTAQSSSYIRFDIDNMFMVRMLWTGDTFLFGEVMKNGYGPIQGTPGTQEGWTAISPSFLKSVKKYIHITTGNEMFKFPAGTVMKIYAR